ncbi:MAG: cytochrome-c peroxidase [Steroidobacteraceae bacterium]
MSAEKHERPVVCRIAIGNRGTALVTGVFFLLFLLQAFTSRADETDQFVLSKRCPAYFELLSDNTCHFRSLYELYSPASGAGGLRVNLPPLRGDFSPQKIDLGRYLFFDPLLSADHRVSCAQCHDPGRGFSDGRARSVVSSDSRAGKSALVSLPRSAPTLWNVGFLRVLFWDGRAHSLEEQATGPLFGKNEMANTEGALTRDVDSDPIYKRLFSEAFALSLQDHVTLDMITESLAAFESTLVSVNSRYDRYAHGDDEALSASERHGFAIFRGVALGCAQCHTPPLFTNDGMAVTGVPTTAGLPFDHGAEIVTKKPALRGAFHIPTLRNIAKTAPYMHAGQYATLEDVIKFYNDRAGHAAPSEENLQIDWRMGLTRPVIDEADVHDVVSFLETLTDESAVPEIPPHVPSGLAVIENNDGGKATSSQSR